MMLLFSRPTVPSPPVVAPSIAIHIKSEALPVPDNSSPTTAVEVVLSSGQPKDEQPAPAQSSVVVETSDGDYPPPQIPPTDKLVLGVTHVDKNGVIYGQEIKPGTCD